MTKFNWVDIEEHIGFIQLLTHQAASNPAERKELKELKKDFYKEKGMEQGSYTRQEHDWVLQGYFPLRAW